MGFSTSGAVAILLIAFFIAASVIVPTLFSITSQTGAAFSTQADHLRDQQNTDLTLESVVREDRDDDGDPETLVINATNDGSITLDQLDTDVLIDGRYVRIEETNTTVDDGTEQNTDTRLWWPETTLTIELDEATLENETDGEITTVEEVDRVKLGTQTGITASTNEIGGS